MWGVVHASIAVVANVVHKYKCRKLKLQIYMLTKLMRPINSNLLEIKVSNFYFYMNIVTSRNLEILSIENSATQTTRYEWKFQVNALFKRSKNAISIIKMIIYAWADKPYTFPVGHEKGTVMG